MKVVVSFIILEGIEGIWINDIGRVEDNPDEVSNAAGKTLVSVNGIVLNPLPNIPCIRDDLKRICIIMDIRKLEKILTWIEKV